jgi:ribosomal subunit interface protein
MNVPLQVTFRNMPHSDAIESIIVKKAAALERFNKRITSCRVVVEEEQRRKHQGKVFSVVIDITIPGKEVAISRQESDDAYVAVRDAFDAAARVLEEESRVQHRAVKNHETHPSGRVAKIFPDGDYGFILTPDAREIYFHRNSVQPDTDFLKLKFGTPVVFLEEQGKEGPQAARVSITR